MDEVVIKFMDTEDCRQNMRLTNMLSGYLFGVAAKSRLTDYTLAGACIGLPAHSVVLNEMLGDISKFTYRHYGVFLSAIVHMRGGNNIVGGGLWDIMDECGFQYSGDRTKALIDAVKAVHDWARNLVDS